MTYQRQPLQGAQTSTSAIMSLISGILGVISLILICVPCTRIFSLIFGLAAAILGFIGLNKIKKSQGALTGRGMAIAGLISGVICIITVGILLLIGIGLSIPAFLIPMFSGEFY